MSTIPPYDNDPSTSINSPEIATNVNVFADQITEARERLKMPKDATAWQVMCENAADEVANKGFLRSLFGL